MGVTLLVKASTGKTSLLTRPAGLVPPTLMTLSLHVIVSSTSSVFALLFHLCYRIKCILHVRKCTRHMGELGRYLLIRNQNLLSDRSRQVEFKPLALVKFNSMGGWHMNLSDYMGGWCLWKFNSMGGGIKKSAISPPPPPPPPPLPHNRSVSSRLFFQVSTIKLLCLYLVQCM